MMAENSNNENNFSTNRKRILQYVLERIVPFHDVDIVDAVVTVNGMVKAGLINLNNADADAAIQFEVDEETKKITKLVLACNNNNEAQQQEQQGINNNIVSNSWQLPIGIICRLELLEELDLSFCGSISSSTTMMQSVRSQRRQKRNNSFCFNNLKRLDLQYTYLQHNGRENNIDSDSSSEEEEHSCLFDFLPNIQCIKFGCYNGETIDNVIRDMKTRCVVLNNLQNISFNYTEFNEGHLETFLFDILPKASNLTALDLWSNEIQSVQRIAARCNEEQRQHSNTLRCLDLHCNPILGISTTDPVARAALMTLLSTFKGISNLGACNTEQYHPDVEYLLQINNAGRGRLVEGIVNSKPIPINLLPIVLERAYKKSDEIYGQDFRYGKEKSHVGLFYLVRHGPVLQHIFSRRIQNE